jgi:hypothetical protein
VPIRKDLRKFYGHVWQTVTRPRILKRAKRRCEQCGKPNHRRVYVWRSQLAGQFWSTRLRPLPVWHECLANGQQAGFVLSPSEREYIRRIRVVLTVAHLNHTPGDDRDENLRALCQWCHLHYDQDHHASTRRERLAAARRDAMRDQLSLPL